MAKYESAETIIARSQQPLPTRTGALRKQRMTVAIEERHMFVLTLIAQYERRDTREQAAVLLEWAIRNWKPDASEGIRVDEPGFPIE